MADGTPIEWTDATWNPVTGCSVVSPGCTNCYAMKLAGTRLRRHPSRAGLTVGSKVGPVWTGDVSINWQWFDQPLAWSRPRMIFVCAHGDLFHDGVDQAVIAQIYGIMIAAHHLRGHRFQVLTKRIERARALLNSTEFWDIANADAGMHIMERVDPLNRRGDDARATCEDYDATNPPPGIWLGTSVEDQPRANERVPHLLATPAAMRFLSCEPLLGPVDLTWIEFPNERGGMECYDALSLHLEPGESFPDGNCEAVLDWIIVGGESGPGARPMHPDWARSLRDQCADAGVAFFHKQNGEFAPGEIAGDYLDPDKAAKGFSYFDGRWDECWSEVEGHCDDEPDVYRVGKKRAGRLLDGVEHNGMPA